MLYSQNNFLVFGGDYNDMGASFCITPEGDFIIASNVRINQTDSEDIKVFRINQDGSIIWERVFGTSLEEEVLDIEPAGDNSYILVGHEFYGNYGGNDAYLFKIDNNGYEIWHKYLGTNCQDMGFAVKPVNDGYCVAGFSRGYGSFSIKGDVVLFKTNDIGEEIWVRNFGTDQSVDYGFDVIEAINRDSYIIVGTISGFYTCVQDDFQYHDANIFMAEVDVNGNKTWCKEFGGIHHDFGYMVKEGRDQSYYIIGSTQNKGAGSFDMLLIKIGLDGEIIWEQAYGGIHYDYGKALDIDTMNNVFLTGTTKSFGTQNSADIIVIKTDSDGIEHWNTVIGGEAYDEGNCILATDDGGCAVLGSTLSYGNGYSDILFAKLDSNGNLMPFTSMNDPLDQQLVLVYPIPSTGRVIFKFADDITAEKKQLVITDLTGRILKNISLDGVGFYELHKESLPSGIYLYSVTAGNKYLVASGKLILY